MNWRSIALVVVLASMGSYGAEPPTLEALRAKYARAKDEIEQEADAARAAALDACGKRLAAQLTALKSDGDLEGYLALEHDKGLLDAQGAMPEAPRSPYTEKAAGLYTQAALKADSRANARLTALIKGYIPVLNALIKHHMGRDEIGLAIEIKAELDRVELVLNVLDRRPQEKEDNPADAPAKSFADGLVLHLPFDKDDGGRVRDKSSRHNDGKVKGAVWTPHGRAQDNGAMAFDGKDSHILIRDSMSLDMPGPLTIAFWINLSDVSDWLEIISKGIWDQGYKDTAYIVKIHGATHQLDLWASQSGDEEDAFFRCSDQKMARGWCHYAITFCPEDGITFYVNGVLDSRHDPPIRKIFNSSRPLIIGKGVNTNPQPARAIRGLLDDVMIWSRALSPAEIRQLSEQ